MQMKLKIVGVLMLFILVHRVDAQDESKIRLKHFNHEKQLALDGFDPVAYFTTGKPTKGNSSISAEVGGIVYRFASAKSKDMFLVNPAVYEPQYGGWCAYAMGSSGEKVEIDPETFKIVDGKLYLFYNAYFNNTLKKWNEDESKLKRKADENWNKLQL